MQLLQRVSVVLLFLGLAWTAFAQAPPPDTGKMSWDLFQAVEAGQHKRAAGEEVPVVSALFVTAKPATEEDLAALRELGYTVIGAYGQFILVEAPADQYGDPEKGVNAIRFITNASLPPISITNESITNGTPVIGAPNLWNLGYRGQGVKIAVIDVGYDPHNETLARLNPTYYLIQPSPVQVGVYTAKEGEVAQASGHGTSCAIIVGDVAPEAQLYLLSYPRGTEPIGWLDALHFAVHELGVDVVTTSVEVGRPYCHADGTGPLNEAVNEIMRDTNAVLVIAAGNWAAGSGTDRSFYGATFLDSDGDYRHDFTPDVTDTWDRNTLRFHGNEGDMIYIVLEWDDWNSDVKTQDFDLYLYNCKYQVLLASSRTRQFGRTTDPVEVIAGKLPYTGDYCIVIENRAAKWYGQTPQPVSLHLNLFNKDSPFPFIEHHTACGSVRGVAANPNPWVISVGAVSPKDLCLLRPYSSRGPTLSGHPKPEVCAPDGVTGTAYQKFYGTSAAAPYVAGAVALLRSANPDLSREELLAMLQGTCSGSTDDCGNPLHPLELQEAASKLAKG